MSHPEEPDPPRDEPLFGDGLRNELNFAGFGLAGLLVVLWLIHLPRGMIMYDWAVSAQILAAGYWQNIGLHMLAHAGPLHLAFNCGALVMLSPGVVLRLGGFPRGIPAYLGLFVLSGLAGLAVYLAIHPEGTVPMLGASGAIFGFFGFLVRYPQGAAEPTPLLSSTTGKAAFEFVKGNLILIVILTLPALLSGSGGGLAWEAHLGGFLFGLLAAPLFAPRENRSGR